MLTTAARPGPVSRVLGLLVDGDAAVPAPVDEEAEQHAVGERRRRGDLDGSIQARLGVAAPPLASATTENSARIASSAPSSQRWVSAFSSMPIRQIQVITTIHAQPTSVTAHAVSAAACQPTSRNV